MTSARRRCDAIHWLTYDDDDDDDDCSNKHTYTYLILQLKQCKLCTKSPEKGNPVIFPYISINHALL